jgi:hypothetical protein
MAYTYLFFQPARLPLEPAELGAGVVLNIADTVETRAAVEQSLPGLQWQTQHRASATVEGNWYEIDMPQTAEQTLSLRCSLRVGHGEFVQSICDRSGWLAFDQTPRLFQPNRPPLAV